MNDKTLKIVKIIGAAAVIILIGIVKLYFPRQDDVGAGTPVQEQTGDTDQTKQIDTQELQKTQNNQKPPKTQGTSNTKKAETVSDSLRFGNAKLLEGHFEKHGKDMGFSSAAEYKKAAAAVATNPKALHKT